MFAIVPSIVTSNLSPAILLGRALQGAPMDANTPLISSGLIDSLSMVSLKMFLDQTYHVRIPDAEASAEAFDSASALVALLRRLGVR